MIIKTWRLYCETESKYVYWWLPEDSDAPTTCPNNSAHTVALPAAIVDSNGQESSVGEFGEILVSSRPLIQTLDRGEANQHMPTLVDQCAWYELASTVVEKSLVEDVSDPTHKTLDTEDVYLIDLFHHRIQDEEQIADCEDSKIKVEESIDSVWTELTEQHDIYNAATKVLDYTKIEAGKYFVHYGTGKIHFSESKEGKSLRASYKKANGFQFTLEPAAGKILEIRDAEVQGSVDLEYTCGISFQLRGYDPSYGYSPEYPKVNWGAPLRLGNQWGFLSEGKGNYAAAEAIGGSYIYGEVPRGMAHKSIIMPFPYGTSKLLRSSLGMEMRVVFFEGDGPWNGEFGNATFYCIEEVDPDWVDPV